MTPGEHYNEISSRLRKAKVDLQKAYDEYDTEKAADLVRLIQVLVVEEIDAYNRWMKTAV